MAKKMGQRQMRDAERRHKRRQRWMTVAMIAGAVIVAVGAIVGITAYLNRTVPTEQAIPVGCPQENGVDQCEHIDIGSPHEPYTSDPPVGGPHYGPPRDGGSMTGAPVEAGFYEEPIEDEYLLHDLEHGYVIIWYNCALITEDECATLMDQLRNITDFYDKVVAVPRDTEGMTTIIALTSWGRLSRLTEFNRAAIDDFIRRNLSNARAPEPFAP